MSFSDLGLCAKLVRVLDSKQFTQPTPIQQQAIQPALDGEDLLAAAQTGTGKTAAFALPLVQRLDGETAQAQRPLALILTPTRELAAQVHANINDFARALKLRTTVIFGGVKIQPQIRTLKKGVDILIATPGRLLDLQKQNALQLDQIRILVLDEADRMLDMGFIPDIKRIVKLVPRERQTMLFSATFSPAIHTLAKSFLQQPREIRIAPKTRTAPSVTHKLYAVDKSRKRDALTHLITSNNWDQALVFSRTRHGADKLAKALSKSDISTAVIHGNKSQNQRTRALRAFKQGKVQILVATDIAARGIDIHQLPRVVNFDLPDVAEDYVHRIGRTGRAGAKGYAISLVSADESKQLHAIEQFIKQSIPQETIDGFEPTQLLSTKPARKQPTRRRTHARKGPAAQSKRSKPAAHAHARRTRRKSSQRRHSQQQAA